MNMLDILIHLDFQHLEVLEVNTGTATTALLVKGDARITGILTIGTGSITLNPNTKEVTGIDEIVVGSGASLSLAPLLTQSGKFFC